MTERLDFVKELVNELRTLRSKPPYQPTANVDAVFVVSQPGTVLQPSNDGVYKRISNKEISNDLLVVQAGVEIVKKVTALRTGKNPDSITREDVSKQSPILFYNGEDTTTPNHGYTQNEDLEVMASEPDFPIPRSRIIIDHIDQIGTPAQVIGFANFLRIHTEIKRVAVVSMAPHSIRVGRYLQHYSHLLPEGIVFENACVPERRIPVGSTKREADKTVKYLAWGHLASESIFNRE